MSAFIAVSGLLVSSTGAALLRKVLYQIDGTGLHGVVHRFEKPWFTAWESAVSCWVSIILFWLMQAFVLARKKWRTRNSALQEPLLGGGASDAQKSGTDAAQEEAAQKPDYSSATWKQVFSLIVPGFFSIVSLVTQGLGLRYITATLMLMLSGSCILFTAILSVLLLKCRLNGFHLTGVGLILVGLGFVSVANLIFAPDGVSNGINSFERSHDSLMSHQPSPEGDMGFKDTLLGIVLTLLSMLFMAARLVAEEFALDGTELHSLQVLGYEGMWATILAAAVGFPVSWAIPGSDVGGHEENVIDSFVFLYQTRSVNIVNWLFCLSAVGLNVFGLLVTSRLGSVFRAVLLTTRTAAVWVVNLALFYSGVGGGAIGESWSSPESWIQLAGFALLLLGTIVYAQGSSAVALLLSCKPSEDVESAQPQPRNQVSAVTRLRPYTSLYIPNGPRRLSDSLIGGQSLPNRAVRPPANTLIHYTNSLPANLGLATEAEGTALPIPGDTEQSPVELPSGSLDSAPAAVGISPRSYASASSFFVNTLTDRSSWILDKASRPVRRRLLRTGNYLGSGNSQTDTDTEALDPAGLSPRRSHVAAPAYRRLPTVFAAAESTDLDQDAEIISGIPTKVVPGPADVPSLTQSEQLPEEATGRLSNEVASTQSEPPGDIQHRPTGEAERRMNSVSILQKQLSQSPSTKLGSVEKGRDIPYPDSNMGPSSSLAASFGTATSDALSIPSTSLTERPSTSARTSLDADVPPQNTPHSEGYHTPEDEIPGLIPAASKDVKSGYKHVFGQSPTPELLLQRKSASALKAQPSLGTYKEADEEEPGSDDSSGIDSEEDSDVLPTHTVTFDSDSDVSWNSSSAGPSRSASQRLSSDFLRQKSSDSRPGLEHAHSGRSSRSHRSGKSKLGKSRSSAQPTRNENDKSTNRDNGKGRKAGSAQDESLDWSGNPMSL